jgi:hypothetical protein
MRKPTHAVTVHVPGLPGAEYVWRRRTVYVNKTEFNQIRQWKIKGWGSKSAMVLALYPHRVIHHSTV